MGVALIRPARLEEIERLREFEQRIVAAERPFDPTLRETGVRYYDIPALLADPDSRFLVADVAGASVGCGFARIDAAKPYLRHARQAYLGLMYVDVKFRGQGINRQIVEELMQWCRSRQVQELRLDVYAHNRPAVRAYEKAGFEAHLLQMRVELAP